MPIDDLTALWQKMREARKNKELTQQELSDLSHVSVKQIANIEKGKMNPSYLILIVRVPGTASFPYTPMQISRKQEQVQAEYRPVSHPPFASVPVLL